MDAEVDPVEVKGPYLDPFNERMFRAAIDQERPRLRAVEINRVENRKKRPRRSRRRRRG